MESNKLSIIILAFIAVAVQATISEVELQPKSAVDLSPKSAEIAPKWDDLGISANLNNYVDSTIHMLVPFIQEHGLDPMPLPDVAQGFQVRPLLITYSAWLRIREGSMTGLVNVQRHEDQMVHYFAKMLRIKLRLQFSDMQINYRYLVKVMNIGPTGRIIATLNRFVANIDLLIDFNNDEIHLQEFSVSDIGRLRVRFTGNLLYDWLVNAVSNVFLITFDDVIIHVVVANIRNFVQTLILQLNGEIKNILENLENIYV